MASLCSDLYNIITPHGHAQSGPDGLTAEHVKEGGDVVTIWLMRLLNAVVELEVIPDALKCGVVVPVYKGGGKDPLKVDSYRGITLSSVIAKVLEFLTLNRLQMVFMEASIPHTNKSAYRRRVSCADAIFATQEVISRFWYQSREYTVSWLLTYLQCPAQRSQ